MICNCKISKYNSFVALSVVDLSWSDTILCTYKDPTALEYSEHSLNVVGSCIH